VAPPPKKGITGNRKMSTEAETYFTERKRKAWWAASAQEWLADPTADSELLFVASLGTELADPTLSRQCLVEARERRRGGNK